MTPYFLFLLSPFTFLPFYIFTLFFYIFTFLLFPPPPPLSFSAKTKGFYLAEYNMKRKGVYKNLWKISNDIYRSLFPFSCGLYRLWPFRQDSLGGACSVWKDMSACRLVAGCGIGTIGSDGGLAGANLLGRAVAVTDICMPTHTNPLDDALHPLNCVVKLCVYVAASPAVGFRACKQHA